MALDLEDIRPMKAINWKPHACIMHSRNALCSLFLFSVSIRVVVRLESHPVSGSSAAPKTPPSIPFAILVAVVTAAAAARHRT